MDLRLPPIFGTEQYLHRKMQLPRDGNECLVRTVEAGFQQPAGDEIPLKIEVRGTISPVGDLDRAQGIQCQLDAVAPHGKKNCTLASGSRSRCRAGDILLRGFTAQADCPGCQQPGFQVFPLHNSSASSYFVKKGMAATAPTIPRPFMTIRRSGILDRCQQAGFDLSPFDLPAVREKFF